MNVTHDFIYVVNLTCSPNNHIASHLLQLTLCIRQVKVYMYTANYCRWSILFK